MKAAAAFCLSLLLFALLSACAGLPAGREGDSSSSARFFYPGTPAEAREKILGILSRAGFGIRSDLPQEGIILSMNKLLAPDEKHGVEDTARVLGILLVQYGKVLFSCRPMPENGCGVAMTCYLVLDKTDIGTRRRTVREVKVLRDHPLCVKLAGQLFPAGFTE
jgi:hypothetical protein